MIDPRGRRRPDGPDRTPNRKRRRQEGEKMGSFLRENWIWIVAPLVLVLVAVGVLLLAGSGGEGEDAAFIYNIF
jgi:hypothetical protein